MSVCRLITFHKKTLHLGVYSVELENSNDLVCVRLFSRSAASEPDTDWIIVVGQLGENRDTPILLVKIHTVSFPHNLTGSHAQMPVKCCLYMYNNIHQVQLTKKSCFQMGDMTLMQQTYRLL